MIQKKKKFNISHFTLIISFHIHILSLYLLPLLPPIHPDINYIKK